MNWIKKWYYLILLVSTGIVYLACVNDWQVYARVMDAAKGGGDTQVSGYKNAVNGDEDGKGGSFGNDGNGVWNGPPVSGGDGSWNGVLLGSENGVWNGPAVSGGDGGWNGLLVSGGNGVWIGLPVGSGNSVWNGPAVSGGNSGWESQPGYGDSGWQPEDENSSWKQGDETGVWATGDEDGDWQLDGEDIDGQDESAETGISYMTVEDDYFADAVFIGDSRTVGMSEYGGLEDIATFYASTGLSVHKLFTANIVPVQGQKKKVTVEEALQENTFSKIYLMIGINEMGTGTVDTFMEKYEEAVAHLQELQPDAVIYLQGIMKVTTKRSEQGDYITNEGIEVRNERIAQLADNEKIFYLDVNPLICDETGGMEESYTHDGVHLKAKYIEIWKQFLKEHVVIKTMSER